MIKLNDGLDYVTVKEGAEILKINYFALYYHLPKLKIKKMEKQILIELKSLKILEYIIQFKNKNNNVNDVK